MDDKRRNDQTEESEEKIEEVENAPLQEEQIDEVGQELERLQTLTEQLDNQLKRSLADYQNLQRRVQEEKKEWATYSKGQAVLKFLPILDTLMLAEKHTKDQNFVLTVQQFLRVLQDEGFERIKTIGETFDPLLMEPVGTAKGEEHIVLEEVKVGFKLGEMVVRPAAVIVGQEEEK